MTEKPVLDSLEAPEQRTKQPPGRTFRTEERSYRIALAIVVVATLAIFLWGLGAIPLMSLSEARRAVPMQEMLASGDWLLPTLNGELYITKPPLLYWLTSSLASASGSTSEWIVRLPSALAALALAWAVFFITRREFGRWPALFALIVLVANAGFANFGRSGEIEMLLTALCAGSNLAFFHYIFHNGHRYWLPASYLFLGLALLTKGPVALLFVLPPLLIFAVTTRHLRARQALLFPWGWLLMLAVGSSWYLAVVAELGLEPWRSVLSKDIAGKVSNDSGSDFYAYPLWFLGDFLPFSLLLLFSFRRTVVGWWQTASGKFLVYAGWIPFGVLSLFDAKNPKYLLPVYPVMAILMGLTLADLYRRVNAKWQQRLLTGSLAVVIAYVVYFSVLQARYFSYRFEALPRIASFLDGYPQVPVFSHPKPDMRAVYYHGAPIPALDTTALASKQESGQAALLLVRRKSAQPFAQQEWCEMVSFSPYLGREKEAVIFGTGYVCGPD